MKVLCVTNMFPSAVHPYSGIFVAREVAALKLAGVEVEVEPIGGARGARDYFAARARIRRVVHAWRADLCHVHYGYSLVAAVGCGRPIVATFYGDDVNGESNGRGGVTLKSWLGLGVTNLLGRAARRVLVQSEAMRARLWPMLRPRAEVLASGVDDHLFAPGDPGLARARLGIPLDRPVIGFINSGNQPTKRLDLAQATRDELIRRGRTVYLLVAERVPAEEMPWYYQASDCLLLTSDSEGSPNCVKEAFACGVPVVSVPVGDVPDLLTVPERGRIAGRSPSHLANAVESVLQMPRASKSLLPDHLQASHVAARLVEIYQQVVLPR